VADYKRKTRWFFPVVTLDDSLEAIKVAYQATFALAGLQAALLCFLMWSTGQWSANIADPFFMIALAWALKTRQSRTAAVVLLLYSILIGFTTLAARVGAPLTDFAGRNIILAVLFIFASYKGTQGTFGYHRLKKTSVNLRNVSLLILVTFGYCALYTVIFIGLFLLPGTAVWVDELSEDALGLIWFLPVVAIVFIGGFGWLPGTKGLVTIASDQHGTEYTQSYGYIAKHWRGELTLATSYWINVFFVGAAFAVAFTLLEGSDLFQTNLLLHIQLAVGLMLLAVPVTIWQIGGCWRAARNHIRKTERSFWARVVQVLLVLGVMQAIVQWTVAAPAIVEYVKIASRTEDFTEYTITLLGDGDEVKISGHLAFGIDREFKSVLQDNPDIWIIHLDSTGGRLDPARKTRDIIEQYGLATYVPNQCHSACLLLFMAGSTRILNMDGKLGFHRYRFPGAEDDEISQEISIDKAYFERRGLRNEFLERAFQTESSQFWFPTIDELIANGVITHTFDGQDFVEY